MQGFSQDVAQESLGSMEGVLPNLLFFKTGLLQGVTNKGAQTGQPGYLKGGRREKDTPREEKAPRGGASGPGTDPVPGRAKPGWPPKSPLLQDGGYGGEKRYRQVRDNGSRAGAR